MRKVRKHRKLSGSNIPQNSCTLIDSLGTWVANCLETEDTKWEKQTQNFLKSLENATTDSIIMVAEETGWGVVPAYELGRKFRSRLGKLIRQVGVIADDVYLVVGGYAINVTKIGININEG